MTTQKAEKISNTVPIKIGGGSSSQSGWPLRNIHISNNNRSFTIYVDVFFPLSLPRLLPNFTVYMSNTVSILANDVLHTNSRVDITPKISILANDVLPTNSRMDITPQISILANDVLHTKFQKRFHILFIFNKLQIVSHM
jgi:hypothetical protein